MGVRNKPAGRLKRGSGQRDVAALTPGTQLHLLMVFWRRRLRPDDLPKPARAGQRRRGQQYSQEDVARAAKVATRWYGTLERGELDNVFSADLLYRVAQALRLDAEERRVLFLLAGGTEPAPLPSPELVTVSPAMRAMLECHPWPAYVTDETWQLLAFNQATLEWFPYVNTETNMMRWLFCSQAAREQLIDWENKHVPLMLAQLRAQYARMPESSALLELISEVLSSSDYARELWTTQPVVSLEKFTQPRQMYIAGVTEPTTVTVISMVPYTRPEIRYTTIIPIGGHIPPNCVGRVPVLPTQECD